MSKFYLYTNKSINSFKHSLNITKRKNSHVKTNIYNLNYYKYVKEDHLSNSRTNCHRENRGFTSTMQLYICCCPCKYFSNNSQCSLYIYNIYIYNINIFRIKKCPIKCAHNFKFYALQRSSDVLSLYIYILLLTNCFCMTKIIHSTHLEKCC